VHASDLPESVKTAASRVIAASPDARDDAEAALAAEIQKAAQEGITQTFVGMIKSEFGAELDDHG